MYTAKLVPSSTVKPEIGQGVDRGVERHRGVLGAVEERRPCVPVIEVNHFHHFLCVVDFSVDVAWERDGRTRRHSPLHSSMCIHYGRHCNRSD